MFPDREHLSPTEEAPIQWGYPDVRLTIPKWYTIQESSRGTLEGETLRQILDSDWKKETTPHPEDRKPFISRVNYGSSTYHARRDGSLYSRDLDLKHKLLEEVRKGHAWSFLINPTDIGDDRIGKLNTPTFVGWRIFKHIQNDPQSDKILCYGSCLPAREFHRRFLDALAGNGSLMSKQEANDFAWMKTTNMLYFFTTCCRSPWTQMGCISDCYGMHKLECQF